MNYDIDATHDATEHDPFIAANDDPFIAANKTVSVQTKAKSRNWFLLRWLIVACILSTIAVRSLYEKSKAPRIKANVTRAKNVSWEIKYGRKKVPEWESWDDVSAGQCTIPRGKKKFNETNFLRSSSEHDQKIAFLFILTDSLHFQKLWSKYFENVDSEHYQVFVHFSAGKGFMNVTFPYTVVPTVESSWCEIVGVLKQLLNFAYKDTRISGAYTISASCVPIRPFKEVQKILQPRVISRFFFSNPKFTKAQTWAYYSRDAMAAARTTVIPTRYGCKEEFWNADVAAKVRAIHRRSTFDCWDYNSLVSQTNEQYENVRHYVVTFKTLGENLLSQLYDSGETLFLRKVIYSQDVENRLLKVV